MADKKISQLTATTTTAAGDIYPLVQGGVTKHIDFDDIIASLPDASVSVRGLVNTSAQSFAGLKTFSNNIISAVVTGASTASGTLTLSSTSNATKGKILFGTSAYDEVNNRLGIGTASPAYQIDIIGTSNVNGYIKSTTNTGSTTWTAQNDANSVAQLGMWGSTRVAYGAIASGNGFIYADTDLAITTQGSIKFGTGTAVPERGRIFSNTGNWFIGGTPTDAGFRLDVNGTARVQGDLTISTKNIITDTTTGTKIGTATGQKLGFWNAAPIVQPTTAVAAATLVGGGGTNITDTDTFDGYTLQQVVKALRNAGLLA